MGFFSSRRAEPEPMSEDDGGDVDRSLSRVIRSKWYNKSKPKAFSPAPVPSASTSSVAAASAVAQRPVAAAARPAPAPQTDNVTMSLAQRLNELASANENGLLDDDQYRRLRQNLFERFASPADAQAEAGAGQPRIPHAPTSRASTSANPPAPSLAPAQQPPHGSARAPSVRSSRSVSSAMSSLFRRAPVRTNSQESIALSIAKSSLSSPSLDTASVLSSRASLSQHSKEATHPSITLTRSGSSVRLFRQNSMASMVSDADGVSVISRRTGHRSTKSRGPPSSFNVRFHEPSPLEEGLHDQATLMAMSSSEIRAEIAKVEAEGRRLLDAFSGLELSTMARNTTPRPGAHALERTPSTWTLVPNDSSVALPSPSALSSPVRPRGKLNGYRSNESLRASSTHLPAPRSPAVTVSENEDPAEAEVEDIRHKRDEVRSRYERKIEYLHAMLRGAEIREKLAKKKK